MATRNYLQKNYTSSNPWSSREWNKYNPYVPNPDDLAGYFYDRDPNLIRTKDSLALLDSEYYSKALEWEHNLYSTQAQEERDTNYKLGLNTDLLGLKSAPSESQSTDSLQSSQVRAQNTMTMFSECMSALPSAMQQGLQLLTSVVGQQNAMFGQNVSLVNALGGVEGIIESTTQGALKWDSQLGKYVSNADGYALKGTGINPDLFRGKSGKALHEFLYNARYSSKGQRVASSSVGSTNEALSNPFFGSGPEIMAFVNAYSKAQRTLMDLTEKFGITSAQTGIMQQENLGMIAALDGKVLDDPDYQNNYLGSQKSGMENQFNDQKQQAELKKALNGMLEDLYKNADNPENSALERFGYRMAITTILGVIGPLMSHLNMNIGAQYRNSVADTKEFIGLPQQGFSK